MSGSKSFWLGTLFLWIRRTFLLLLLTGLSYGLGSTKASADVGQLPTPTLQGVQVQAETSFEAGTQLYTYTYAVSNPATNTGQIWRITIDVTTRIPPAFGVPAFDSSGLTIPRGAASFKPFDQVLESRKPLAIPAGTSVLPYGQRVPPGWAGGLDPDGFAVFYSRSGTPKIMPGASLGGFELISRGMPTIHNIRVMPHWLLVLDSEEQLTPEIEQAAEQISQAIIFRTFTLGPSALTPGTFAHWDQLRDDLNQAIQLGWVPDQTLASTLVAQLASARQALDAQDGTLAKTRLQTVIQTVNQSTSAQRRREVVDLLVLNAQRLIESTADTPVPFEPKATLTPQSSMLPIGTLYTLTATVVNAGDPANPPISELPLMFRLECVRLVADVCEVLPAHEGLFSLDGVTDANGQLRFSFVGQFLGKDIISVQAEPNEEGFFLGSAEVTWAGGPDLVVPLFIPPLLVSEGGKPVMVTDWTSNLGSVASPPSITRYFLSTEATVDPATARVIGERAIPTLAPGERSDGSTVTFTLPSDLPAGTFTLAACADPAEAIPELNEQNNCSFSKVEGVITIVMPVEREANSPPVCSQASPSVARLWPPNHKLVTITVQGVTDPDNDPATIKVTGVTQDEPVNGLGDGDTSPDGFGVGTAQAQVRAERSGKGNGRVYAIAFTADDGKGGTCTGSVSVGVPHDQGKGSTPINDGQRFDSTKP